MSSMQRRMKVITRDKVAESNRIEGIHREPTDDEIAEHNRFVSCAKLTVEELIRFVSVYQSNAVLRDLPGLDVIVGKWRPMPGGPLIRQHLENFLISCNERKHEPFNAHVIYEMIHPFTDGNGRSGRALWYWMMMRAGQTRLAELGFLHAFYYQALEHMQDPNEQP